MSEWKPDRDEVKEVIATYLKGLAMGAADSVPGVSGGTIAVITGIYERLIEAITSFRPPSTENIKIYSKKGRQSLIEYIRKNEFFFLGSLGAGILTSVILLSRFMHYALGNFRAETFAFFFGLIAASVIVLYSEVRFDEFGDYLSAFTGFVIAFLLSGASSIGLMPNTPIFLFLAGLIAISAMILPGISGSFILLILGQYEYLTGALTRFVDSILQYLTGEFTGVKALPDIVSFIAGAVAGVFTISFIVRYMLENYREYTFVFLVSLMAGSLRLPVMEIVENSESSMISLVGLGVPMFLGASSVILLDRYTQDLDYS